MIGLFLDESGTNSLAEVDNRYPMFVLSGVIMDCDYHRDVFRPSVSQLKTRYLGSDEPILRWANITRMAHGFEPLRDWELKKRFIADLKRLYLDSEFTVVACAIDKVRHKKQYVDAVDPYEYALEVVLERFVMELSSRETNGMVVVESRGKADPLLLAQWERIREFGGTFISGTEARNRIPDFLFREKSRNDPGLQLADIAANPIGRHLLGMSLPEEHYLTFDVISRKFRQVGGTWVGYGLKILP